MSRQMICDLNSLNQILSEVPVLYGAGRVTKTIIKYAACHDYNVAAVIVSEAKENPLQIMGVSVLSISGYDMEEKTLIVSVKENLHDEIQEKLSGYKIEKIYYVTDQLFNILTYKIADFELDNVGQISSLVKKNEYITTRINQILNGLNNQFFNDKVLWNRVTEREAFRSNWGDITKTPSFLERYSKLICGLDEESIETVARILNRIKICLNSESKELDIFTREECKELIMLKEKFRELIIKHSESLYIYKNYYLPCNYFLPSVFVYKHGIDKVSNLSTIKGKIVIDVGGYVGDSVLILEELQPQKIITFEAIEGNAELLHKTLAMNKLENVDVVHSALGNYNGTILMNVSGSASSCVAKGELVQSGYANVPIMTLDNYVTVNNIEDIALIKVDIEGAERDFLQGAKETIKKFKPVLLLSIYHSACDFFELKPMLEEWNLGYRFSIFKPMDGSIANDTLLIAECVK